MKELACRDHRQSPRSIVRISLQIMIVISKVKELARSVIAICSSIKCTLAQKSRSIKFKRVRTLKNKQLIAEAAPYSTNSRIVCSSQNKSHIQAHNFRKSSKYEDLQRLKEVLMMNLRHGIIYRRKITLLIYLRLKKKKSSNKQCLSKIGLLILGTVTPNQQFSLQVLRYVTK